MVLRIKPGDPFGGIDQDPGDDKPVVLPNIPPPDPPYEPGKFLPGHGAPPPQTGSGRHPGTGKPTPPPPPTTPLPIVPRRDPPSTDTAPPILPQKNFAPAPSRTDTVLPITQPLPVIYGGAVSCGAQIVYDHVRADNTRLVCYAICWGPINAISNVTVDATNNFTPVIHLGGPAQSIDTNLAGDNALWTSLLPGVAYVSILFPQPTASRPPPDISRFLCDVQGMMIRDPRQDATLVTRYYLDNPALILADYMTSSRFGGSIADAQMDFAGSVTTSANDCDVLLADAVTKRFTMGIRLDATRAFEEWKETLRAHAQLNVVYNSGLYQIWMDKAQAASSVVFTDVGPSANIIDAGSLKVRGSAQVPTRIKVNFFNATSAKTDMMPDEDELIAVGLVELVEVSYDLPGIKTSDHAKRIARYLRKRAAMDKEATLHVLQDGGIQLLPGLVVTVTSQQLSWTNQLCLVTQCSASGGTWTATVELYSGTVYDDTQKVVTVAGAVAQFNIFAPVLDISKPLASIGARLLVANTTKLTGDITAVQTTILVDDNSLANGDRLYLEATPLGVAQTEYLAVTSAASGTGPYTYSVTRNLAGTGAKAWRAGDVVVDTGTTGSGFVDIYAVRGTKSATEHGPTIVGNVRTSATFSDWLPRWAVGNLNGLYGYITDIYGCAFGVPTGAWVKIDPTNGVRIGFNATTSIQLDASGNASFTGAITATSGSFTGTITSSSGTIGGWTIGASTLSAGGMTLNSAGNMTLAGGFGVTISGGGALFVSGSGGITCAGVTGILVSGGGNVTVTGGNLIVTGGGIIGVSGSQVVGPRGAAVTAPLATIADCQRAINDIISRLSSAAGHGLIT